MTSNPSSRTRKIGVISRSSDRYQEIARAIDGPCVWLSGAEWISALDALDTVIIDSEMLSRESGLADALRAGTPYPEEGLSAFQGDAILSYAAHLSRTKNILVFQCSDQGD